MRSPTSAHTQLSKSEPSLSIGQALALGALHGPAELLPVSSAAHVTIVPWLLGWDYNELDPALRKSFEVALHAGTAGALLIVGRHELGRLLDRKRLLTLAAASAPPALAGYALEQQIERRLGAPGTIAAALLCGAALMLVADTRPQERPWQDVQPKDGLWLGIAQAVALAPGISRAGATSAVARLLRFRSGDAGLLSDEVGLPVLIGALAFELAGGFRRLPADAALSLGIGAAASFASTGLAAAALGSRRRLRHALPYAAYRAGLAGLIFIRLRRDCAPRRKLGSNSHDQGHGRLL